MTFEVIAYEDVNGKIPVQDFLKQLNNTGNEKSENRFYRKDGRE